MRTHTLYFDHGRISVTTWLKILAVKVLFFGKLAPKTCFAKKTLVVLNTEGRYNIRLADEISTN